MARLASPADYRTWFEERTRGSAVADDSLEVVAFAWWARFVLEAQWK